MHNKTTLSFAGSSFTIAAVLFGGCARPAGEGAGLDTARSIDEQAIVGGATTTIGAHPWQVSLQDAWGNHFCGGSIIGAGWVITAQHCVEGESASNLRVLAGVTKLSQASQGQLVRVSQIVRNPGYSSPEVGHDVALLKLSTPLTLNTNVAAVAPVSEEDVAAGVTDTGALANVSGWGTLSSGAQSTPDTLYAVDVPIVSTTTASQSLGVTLNAQHLAAGTTGKDSCQGDSGGPLTAQAAAGTVLVGVVSWGYGCGDRGFPGIYARLSTFRAWVDEVLAGGTGTTDPNDPGTAEPPPGWMCDPTWVGDGECDCGCGAPDSDCPNNALSSCQYNECDEWNQVQGLSLDTSDPTQCADDGGSTDNPCPLHASLTPDGSGCACDEGYVPNAALTSCIVDDTNPSTCPAHATGDGNGCACDPGYHSSGASCVLDATTDPGTDPDPTTDPTQQGTAHRPLDTGEDEPAGCSSTTQSPSLALFLLLGGGLVRRRRRAG